MSAGDEWIEVREVRLGVSCNVHRSAPMWSDKSVSVTHRIDPWSMPGTVAEVVAFFATYPADASVHVDDGEGNAGEITVDWIDAATEDDIALRDAKAAAASAAQAERDEFEAWRASRPLTAPAAPGDRS